MSVIEIKNKIVGVEVINEVIKVEPILVKRPYSLDGKTYKIEKSPVTDYNIYVTINDIEVNNKIYPFEIFINSKDLSNQMFIVAMTRLISSIFKNAIYSNSNVEFIAKDLRSIYDASGKFYRKGHKIIPSLVAEIGDVIATHIEYLSSNENISEEEYIKETVKDIIEDKVGDLIQCPNCRNISLVKQTGCDVCLECGYSKC